MATPAPPPTPIMLEEEKDGEKLNFAYPTSIRTRSHADKGQGQQMTMSVPEEDTMEIDEEDLQTLIAASRTPWPASPCTNPCAANTSVQDLDP